MKYNTSPNPNCTLSFKSLFTAFYWNIRCNTAFQLKSVFSSCFQFLPVVFSFFQLFSVSSICFQFLPVVFSFFQLFSVAFSCFQAAFRCFSCCFLVFFSQFVHESRLACEICFCEPWQKLKEKLKESGSNTYCWHANNNTKYLIVFSFLCP